MSFSIGGRRVGGDAPALVIAELGVNHNGDVDLALASVDAAAEAGADVLKLQTFRADRVVAPGARKAAYQEALTGGGETQAEMLRRLELDPAGHDAVLARCRERGLVLLSTPFDHESVDFLARLGVPALKVPSGEITNLPLLRHVAAQGLPLLVSTGMATLEEVGAAMEALREAGGRDVALLHCVTSYPADPAETNLRAMATLAEAFRVPVGYSDHTPGTAVALAAVALGAAVIEKHFTLDRTLPGPDHEASLEPDELASLVRGIRVVESALGDGVKRPTPTELINLPVVRRSLHVVSAVEEGGELTAATVAALRPAGGIEPAALDRVVGRKARRRLEAGTQLRWEDLA